MFQLIGYTLILKIAFVLKEGLAVCERWLCQESRLVKARHRLRHLCFLDESSQGAVFLNVTKLYGCWFTKASE